MSSRPNAAERSERLAIAKAYVGAREHHGKSELLDEIVSAKPEIYHTRYHSAEELKEHGLVEDDRVEFDSRDGHFGLEAVNLRLFLGSDG